MAINNLCIFMGNLTADPELRKTQSGVSVCNFTVAVNDPPYKNKETGELVKPEPYFAYCEIWSSGADRVAEWFKKGHPIFIHSQAKMDTWEKDGVKHQRTRYRVIDFKPLRTKAENEGSGKAKTTKVKPAAAELEPAGVGEDSSIPF